MEEMIEVGFTKKPHGLKGEVKVVIEDAYIEDFFNTEVIFISQLGKMAPFFVESVRGGNAMILKLEGVDTPEAAMKIGSRAVALRARDILEEEEREIEVEVQPYDHCIGYTIIDNTLGSIGEILNIEAFPQQSMAFLSIKGEDVLIPLNEVFIVALDDEAKTIQMDLPEGMV